MSFFQDDFVTISISCEKLKKSKVLFDFLGGKKSIFYLNTFGIKIVNTTALSAIKCVLKEDFDLCERKNRPRKKKGFTELKTLGFVKFKKF